jgi:ABC-type multidrug transport system permease subunit
MPPQQDPRIRDLNDQSTTWLIVAIVGFWLGFGFITGPLAWIKGGRLRAEYRSVGMPPSGSATGAWIIGIVCTALTALVLVSILSCFVIFAGAAATSGV